MYNVFMYIRIVGNPKLKDKTKKDELYNVKTFLCIPLFFNNPIKAYFSKKKYTLLTQQKL